MISPIRKIYSLKEKASNSKELEAFLYDYKAVFNILVDWLATYDPAFLVFNCII
jgi:hypothetical protein